MPTTKPTKAVFLSYASEDAGTAARICETLRSAGIEVWFDQNELRGGDAWDAAIRKQIKTCALFMPIISRNSHDRVEGYFRLEWKLAIDRSHLMAPNQAFLLPVVVDDTPGEDERIPDRFWDLQWTRLPDGHTPPAFVERVSLLLRQIDAGEPTLGQPSLSSTPAAGPQVGVERLPKVAPKLVSGRWKIAAVMAAMIVGGVGYLALRNDGSGLRTAGGDQAAVAAGQQTVLGRSAVLERSIAVLPFVDVSPKQDQQYFTTGMAGAVLELLARIPGLRVIGRTSSFQMKDKAADPRAIGAELGAAYIVQGTVLRSGDQIRVSAQLIDTSDGSQRWASTYNRKASDVFAVQDEIAANLARTLQLTLHSDSSARGATANANAYDVYLRGLRSLDQWSKADTEEAIGDFQQALSLDPKFARAALGLAKAYRMSGVQVWMPASVAFTQARQEAEHALRLDPRLSEAHAVLGEIALTYDWDAATSDREIKEATKLGGGLETLQAAARLAAAKNQWHEAIELFQRALAVDPLDANLHVLLGWGVDMRSRRYPEAEKAFRRALAISSDYGSARWTLGQALIYQNRLDEALDVMQHESPDNGQFEGMAVVYHAMGKNALSDAWMKRAIEHDAELYPSAIAKACAYRGELDQAMKWLEKAYAVKDGDLYFIRHEPLMKNLEGDSRYQAFLRKMNLSE